MKLSMLFDHLPYLVETRGNMDVEITALCSNSREKTENALFFCIPGARFDAHDYAPQAVENGCVALVVEHYVDVVQQWQQQYGPVAVHFLPHDAAHRDPHGQSYVESLARCGIQGVRVVPRTPDVWRGINALRRLLSKSWFHRATLRQRLNPRGELEPSGLTCLEMYRSAQENGCREMPVHDAASHSADAARMFAEAFEHGMLTPITRARPPRLARMS